MKSNKIAVRLTLETTESLGQPRETFRRFLPSYARCGSFSCLLVILIILTGCGGGGADANNVTVTVAPAATTIPVNGQVTLHATVNGDCSTCTSSIYLWYVTEDDDFGGVCDWFTTPPTAPCPAGTIQETAGDISNTFSVTYFAPSTAGTYHVVAEWSDGFGSITKTGTSVVTVGP
jgi:hypothetical protein